MIVLERIMCDGNKRDKVKKEKVCQEDAGRYLEQVLGSKSPRNVHISNWATRVQAIQEKMLNNSINVSLSHYLQAKSKREQPNFLAIIAFYYTRVKALNPSDQFKRMQFTRFLTQTHTK
jgi:hypothetical protein